MIESPKLFVEPALGSKGNGDDLGSLTLSPALEDEVGTGAVTIVQAGFDEDAPGVDVTGFGDGPFSFSLTRGALGRDEAKVGHEGSGRAEAPDVFDLAKRGQTRQGLRSAQATKSPDERTKRRWLGQAFELGVKSVPLHLEVLEMFELSGQSDVEWPFTLLTQPGEPLTMSLSPGACPLAIDEAPVQEDPGDPVLCRLAAGLLTHA